MDIDFKFGHDGWCPASWILHGYHHVLVSEHLSWHAARLHHRATAHPFISHKQNTVTPNLKPHQISNLAMVDFPASNSKEFTNIVRIVFAVSSIGVVLAAMQFNALSFFHLSLPLISLPGLTAAKETNSVSSVSSQASSAASSASSVASQQIVSAVSQAQDAGSQATAAAGAQYDQLAALVSELVNGKGEFLYFRLSTISREEHRSH